MEKCWKVYIHTNDFNGKKYVGITSKADPNKRWQNGKGYKHNKHFTNSIEKYGWENFDHTVIADCLSEHEAKNMEVAMIALFNSKDSHFGYNMTDGGDGTKGMVVSDATRKKISEAMKKENLDPEVLKRRSMALKNRKLSEEHKNKIGESNSKPVCMYSIENIFIKRFPSAHSVERELGISHSHISQCCNGERKTTGGYKWHFANP